MEPALQIADLRLQFLLGRLPFQLEPFRAALAAVMGKTCCEKRLLNASSGCVSARLAMRSSRSSTALPPLGVGDGASESRAGLTAFPAPALPGCDPRDWSSRFNGTIRSSDFRSVICRPSV